MHANVITYPFRLAVYSHQSIHAPNRQFCYPFQVAITNSTELLAYSSEILLARVSGNLKQRKNGQQSVWTTRMLQLNALLLVLR